MKRTTATAASPKQAEGIACYARTSREDYAKKRSGELGVSIHQQVADSHRKAKELGGTIPKELVFIDDDKSSTLPPAQYQPDDGKPTARRKTRPGLTALLDAVAAGKVKTLILRKRDRLSRPMEQTLWLYRFLERHRVKLVCTHEAGFANDAAGRLSVRTLALIAEFQLEQTRENIQDAMDYLKANGLKIGSASTPGFVDAEKGKVAVHEADAAVMLKVFQRIANEEKLSAVNRWLDEHYRDILQRVRHGKSWQVQNLKRWLMSPKYVGLNPDGSPSKVYTGIIPPELFWRVQEILKNREANRVRWKIKRHLLSGVLKCGYCGSNLIVTTSGTITDKTYACLSTEPHRNQPVRIRESQWLRFVELLFVDSREGPLVSRYGFDDRTKLESAEVSTLKIQLSQLDEMLEQLADQLAAQKINVDAYTTATTKLAEKKRETAAELAAVPPQRHTVYKPWQKCSDAEKASVVRDEIRLISVYEDRVSVDRFGRYHLDFPVLRLSNRRGIPTNALLPVTPPPVEDMMLVLDSQFLTDGEPNDRRTATMDWESDLLP